MIHTSPTLRILVAVDPVDFRRYVEPWGRRGPEEIRSAAGRRLWFAGPHPWAGRTRGRGDWDLPG